MGHPERNTTTAVSAGDHSMKGHLALLLANTMFGFNVPIAKGVLASGMVSPYALNLFRMGGAALLFWIASLFAPREKVSRKDLVLLFFASLFSIQLNQTSFLIGLSMTSPIDASIAASTVPILTMLIAAVYLKEPITWKKAIGVAVGASGALLLILSNGTVDTAGRSGSIAGDMICLMGALSFAIYLAVFKRLIARYSSVTLMKWMFLFSTLITLPFAIESIWNTPAFHKEVFDGDRLCAFVPRSLGRRALCGLLRHFLFLPVDSRRAKVPASDGGGHVYLPAAFHRVGGGRTGRARPVRVCKGDCRSDGLPRRLYR